MAWHSNRPGDPKYQTPQHRALAATYKATIRAGQPLTCTARTCELPTRAITNPDGNAPDGVTVGHADNGVDYDGPQHRVCNVNDGARRGRARRDQPSRWRL